MSERLLKVIDILEQAYIEAMADENTTEYFMSKYEGSRESLRELREFVEENMSEE